MAFGLLKFVHWAFTIGGILGLMFAIFTGVGYGFNTHDWKPLADATIGTTLARDLILSQSIDQLERNDLSVQATNYWRDEITKSLIFIAIILIGLSILGIKIVEKFGGFANNAVPFTLKIMIMGIVVILFVIAELFYSVAFLGNPLFREKDDKNPIIPFEGVGKLFIKGKTWLSNYGSFNEAPKIEGLEVLNQSNNLSFAPEL